MSIKVQSIKPSEALPWLLSNHYAHRKCPISYAFGAYRDGELIGVVTYGMPVGHGLVIGVCGPEYGDKVLELNRLCCENTKNIASMLVGRSLDMLPKPMIVVSYADTSVGHVGYIYQATNFAYTGLSAKWVDKIVVGAEKLHNRHQLDSGRSDEEYFLKERARKHRYVFFCGNGRQKKELRAALKYPVEPYPKGESVRYDTGDKVATQGLLF
jgi:hypothetical protein